MSDDTSMMPIAATRAEVAAQPQVVARVLQALADDIAELAWVMASRRIQRVFASGSGDSWFAAQAVQLAWERYAGVSFEAMQAYEYAAYGRAHEDSGSAHIVISSSGRPTTTWDALDRALASPALVVGITDNPARNNPFVSRPTAALIPGASKVGWPAQTTSATLAVLLKLALAFGRERGFLPEHDGEPLRQELAGLPAKMEQALADGSTWAERLAPTLSGKRVYTLVGGGPGYAVAQNGAALLAEGPQEVGVALTVEEFHHGLRVATLQPDDPVVLIAPGGAGVARCRDTARSVRAWGAHLLPILAPGTADLLEDQAHPASGILLPEVEEPFSPLLTLLPLHMLSIVLAEQKVAGGYSRPERVP